MNDIPAKVDGHEIQFPLWVRVLGWTLIALMPIGVTVGGWVLVTVDALQGNLIKVQTSVDDFIMNQSTLSQSRWDTQRQVDLRQDDKIKRLEKLHGYSDYGN